MADDEDEFDDADGDDDDGDVGGATVACIRLLSINVVSTEVSRDAALAELERAAGLCSDRCDGLHTIVSRRPDGSYRVESVEDEPLTIRQREVRSVERRIRARLIELGEDELVGQIDRGELSVDEARKRRLKPRDFNDMVRRKAWWA